MLSDTHITHFLLRHGLPDAFRATIVNHYLPLAKRLPDIRGNKRQLLLGINGAQGTGKSTLAAFLKLAAESIHGWSVAVMSIDDFYLTRDERRQLANNVHPLLATRGVPGTHDVSLLENSLDDLANGRTVALPRFDKAIDDRDDRSIWPVVEGSVDLVILEGWCVGSTAQDPESLVNPCNTLERDADANGSWRRYVNDQLKHDYERLFDRLDALVFLQAPSFDSILRWRIEQEQKLADTSSANPGRIMNRQQMERFVQHFERITIDNLRRLPERADLVFELAEDHSIAKEWGLIPIRPRAPD